MAHIVDCLWLIINLAGCCELLMLYRWQIERGSASDLVACRQNPAFVRLMFPCLSDVCIGLRLQQVMKSQWQTKSLERSKPLKKLSLKHKLSSSKEKHKFTNSLMAVSEYKRWSTSTLLPFHFRMQNFHPLQTLIFTS